jgi:hypothetical protein
MRNHPIEPERLASSLLTFAPDEAYEIALDFMNNALLTQDRQCAMTWSVVLTLVEKTLSDHDGEAGYIRDMRADSMM